MDGVNSLFVARLLWCMCLFWAAVPSVVTGSNRNIILASLGREDTLLHIAPYLDGNSTGDKLRHFCQPASVLELHRSNCLSNVTRIGPVRSEPQFGVTVQQKTYSINNSTTILPTHHIQLVHNMVNPTQLLECLAAEDGRQSQPLIILNFVACFSENVLFKLLEETHPIAPEALFLHKIEQLHLTYDRGPTSVTKQQLSFLAEYGGPFFFPYPTPSDLYEAVLTFVHQMGWRRVAFIQQCMSPLPETLVAHLKTWAQLKRSETILSHSSRRGAGFETLSHTDVPNVNVSDEMRSDDPSGPTDPVGDVFDVLQDLDVLELVYNGSPHDVLQEVYQNERRIIIFDGQVCEYFELLVEAHKKLLYGPG